VEFDVERARADLQAAHAEKSSLEDCAAHLVFEQLQCERLCDARDGCVARHEGDQVGRGRRGIELVQIELTADCIGAVQPNLGRATVGDLDVIQPERQICRRDLPQPPAQQTAAALQRRERFFLRDVRAQGPNLPARARRVVQRK